jgi:hypothetical protein
MTLEESVIICGAIVEEQHHLVVFIKYVCAVDILFHMGIILRFHMGVADRNQNNFSFLIQEKKKTKKQKQIKET